MAATIYLLDYFDCGAHVDGYAGMHAHKCRTQTNTCRNIPIDNNNDIESIRFDMVITVECWFASQFACQANFRNSSSAIKPFIWSELWIMHNEDSNRPRRLAFNMKWRVYLIGTIIIIITDYTYRSHMHTTTHFELFKRFEIFGGDDCGDNNNNSSK